MLGDFINRKTIINQIKWKFHNEAFFHSNSLEFYPSFIENSYDSKKIGFSLKTTKILNTKKNSDLINKKLTQNNSKDLKLNKTFRIFNQEKFDNENLSFSKTKILISSYFKNKNLKFIETNNFKLSKIKKISNSANIFKINETSTNKTGLINLPIIKYSLVTLNINNIFYKKYGYFFQLTSGLNPYFILKNYFGSENKTFLVNLTSDYNKFKNLSKDDIFLLLSSLKLLENKNDSNKESSTNSILKFERKDINYWKTKPLLKKINRNSNSSKISISQNKLNPFLNFSNSFSVSNWVSNFKFFLSWYPSNFQIPTSGLISLEFNCHNNEKNYLQNMRIGVFNSKIEDLAVATATKSKILSVAPLQILEDFPDSLINLKEKKTIINPISKNKKVKSSKIINSNLISKKKNLKKQQKLPKNEKMLFSNAKTNIDSIVKTKLKIPPLEIKNEIFESLLLDPNLLGLQNKKYKNFGFLPLKKERFFIFNLPKLINLKKLKSFLKTIFFKPKYFKQTFKTSLKLNYLKIKKEFNTLKTVNQLDKNSYLKMNSKGFIKILSLKKEKKYKFQLNSIFKNYSLKQPFIFYQKKKSSFIDISKKLSNQSSKLFSSFIKKDFIKKCSNKQRTNTGNTSSEDNNILDHEEMVDIKNHIQKFINYYMENIEMSIDGVELSDKTNGVVDIGTIGVFGISAVLLNDVPSSSSIF
jgi:hypothetical protein